MTSRVIVSVNGNYKMPVRCGSRVVWVSGRDHEGPNNQDFFIHHGSDSVLTIGPEEEDNGEPS